MDTMREAMMEVAIRNVCRRICADSQGHPAFNHGLLMAGARAAAKLSPVEVLLYHQLRSELDLFSANARITLQEAPESIEGVPYARGGGIARLPTFAEGLWAFNADGVDPFMVPSAWGRPVVDWMDRLAQKLSDPSMGEQALIDWIEVAIEALPALLGDMDVDALAGVVEAGMSAATVAAAADALEKGLTRGVKTFSAPTGPEALSWYAPLAEAVAKLNRKTPIGSKLSSAEWARMPLALRERAQFSARVESARFLATVQDQARKRLSLEKERLANGKSAFVDRGSFIATLRQVAEEEGLNTISDSSQRGSVRDIRSAKRLGLIYDMQTNQAQEHSRWKMDQDADVLDAFPAQRFVRVASVKDPRPDGFWAARWNEAGSAINWSGARQRPMVALKTSPIWQRLSIFGTPWPPFDWGSGMGLEDMDRAEAETFGLLKRDEPVPQMGGGEKDFNAGLKASLTGLSSAMRETLLTAFGDQVEIVGDTARVRK